MSEFLGGYDPEKENLSPQEKHHFSSDEGLLSPKITVSETQTPDFQVLETQPQITLEQVTTLVDENPEIKEFILSKKWNPEELADLYFILQEMIKDNPDNLTTTNLIKKLTEQLLDTAFPQSTEGQQRDKQQKPIGAAKLLQKFAAATTAALLAFLGPIAFKNRSASAAENNDSAVKSKAPTGTEEQAPETATATNENIAALVDQDLTEATNAPEQETALEEETMEVKTVDEWTFDFEKDVHPSRTYKTQEDFDQLVADIKSSEIYINQIANIMNYALLKFPMPNASQIACQEISFGSTEIERIIILLSQKEIQEADSYSLYVAFENLYNFCRNEINIESGGPIFEYLFEHVTDPEAVHYDKEGLLEANQEIVAAFRQQKFEVDGKEISLKTLNKKIDDLLKQAEKYAEKNQKQKLLDTCWKMVELIQFRRQEYIKIAVQLYNRQGEFLTFPEIKLSDYPIPNTPDVTTELGISPK